MSRSTSAIHLDVHPDMRILAFTALVSLVAVIVFGLIPAWRASRLDLSQATKKATGAATAALGRSRIGEGLVIPQIALSLVLTVGAGLLVRTLENLKNSYPGFREQNVLLFSIRPGMIGYTDGQVAELYERLLEQIKQTPTVSAGTFSTFSPLAGWSGFTDARVEGYTPRQGEYPAISVNFVGPRYFRTMGTAVLLGRDIAEEDRAGTPKVAVINEAMAQHFFGDRNPIGRRFSIPGWKADTSPMEIVGVVEKDRKSTRLNSSHGYISYAVFCLKKTSIRLSRPNAAPLSSHYSTWLAAALRPRQPLLAGSPSPRTWRTRAA